MIKDELMKYNQRKEGEKHTEAMYGERRKKSVYKKKKLLKKHSSRILARARTLSAREYISKTIFRP